MTASIVIYGAREQFTDENTLALIQHYGMEVACDAEKSATFGNLPAKRALIFTDSVSTAHRICDFLKIKRVQMLDALGELVRSTATSADIDHAPPPQEVEIPGVAAKLTLFLPPANAPTILHNAAEAIADRARQRDQEDGERSMARTVAAFNAVCGTSLTERQGWLFMAFLKAARATAGGHQVDDYTDGAAYFALAGETAEREAAA